MLSTHFSFDLCGESIAKARKSRSLTTLGSYSREEEELPECVGRQLQTKGHGLGICEEWKSGWVRVLTVDWKRSQTFPLVQKSADNIDESNQRPETTSEMLMLRSTHLLPCGMRPPLTTLYRGISLSRKMALGSQRCHHTLISATTNPS